MGSAYGVDNYPTVAIFESAKLTKCPVDLGSNDNKEDDAFKAAKAKQWIVDRLEEQERIVVQSITSEAFKSQPNEFKHASILWRSSFKALTKLFPM